MDVWTFINEKLSAGIDIMLLYVLESEGSSPGRQGFKMAVAADGKIHGTIGGGIMEHKLVEKARTLLLNAETKILLQHQYHDKTKEKNQSGMICSGSQLNAFVPLSASAKETVEKIIAAEKNTILLSPKGLELSIQPSKGLQYKSDEDWFYSEAVNNQPVIHIIGGGHVGLALSELMHYLGFYIKLYDDRPELNTVIANSFVHEKLITDYQIIGELFNDTGNDCAVIMTMGYRTDAIVLRQLVRHNFFYLGFLGSDHKIKMLMNELETEGISSEHLKNIHAPVGINILSKTTKEIAVSIAAEIILEKNKELPTGRQPPAL